MNQGKKRAYTQPMVTNYGSIAKLTQGGTSQDGGGGGGPLITVIVDLSGLGLP